MSRAWLAGKSSKFGLLTALLLAGCGASVSEVPAGGGAGTGSATGGSSSASGPIAVEDLRTRLASAFCDGIADCCRAAALPYDAMSCKSTAVDTLELDPLISDSPRVRYDPDAAGQCLDAYVAFLRGCVGTDEVPESVNGPCTRALVGLVPPGGACVETNECARPDSGNVSCQIDPTLAMGGTCVVTSAPRHASVGEACSGSCDDEDDCLGSPGPIGAAPAPTCFGSDGLYCNSAGNCQPFVADGGPCSLEGCQKQSYCDAGVCTPKKPDGASCNDSRECAADRCLDPTGNGVAGTCHQRAIADARTCSGDFG